MTKIVFFWSRTIKEEKKKNVLDFDGLEENELDKNELDAAPQEGFVSLDINPLDVDFLLNVLDQLNKQYEKKEIVNAIDGRVAGYNPITLVTTLLPGDGTVEIHRQYDGSQIILKLQREEGTVVNIDQMGSVVPEITTDAASNENSITISIQ